MPRLAGAADGTATNQLLIDTSALTDAERSAVVSALGGASSASQWRTVTVAPNDTVFGVVAKEYHFTDARHPLTAKAIADQIALANGLGTSRQINAGQQLSVPTLPKKPLTSGAVPGWSQALNVSDGSLVLENEVGMPVRENANVRTGTIWNLTLSPKQQVAFFDSLALPVKKKLFAKGALVTNPGESMVEIKAPSTTYETSAITAPIRAPDSVRKTLGSLDPKYAGNYFILDFFIPSIASPCPHGELVLEKARQVLSDLGAQQLQDKIVPVELSFFDNKRRALAEIDKYINSQGAVFADRLWDTRNMLEMKSRPANAPYQVPVLYLQALYGIRVTDPATSVISSSFFVYGDGFKAVPDSYFVDNPVPLLSAVQDDPGSVEDVLSVEPIRSFKDKRREYGVALVGADDGFGVPIGMSSSKGDGVTFIERGRVVGSGGSCNGISAKGTSFATPTIGVQMLLVKAYWQSQGIDLDAVSAKRRVLLASDVIPTYAERYASAGWPNLSRLIRPEGAYLVMLDGREIPARSALGHATITVSRADGGIPDQFVLRAGPGGFSGLQVVGNNVYVFRDDALRWQAMEVVDVSLAIPESGVEIKTLDGLKKSIKGVFAP